MADQRTINVGLSFTADTTKARQELAKLKDDLTKTISTSKIGQETTAQFDEAIKRASQLRGILEGATSATGDFNLTKFRNELDRSGMTMQQVFTSLKEIGATDVFNDLAAQIQNSNSRANILSGTLKKFAQGLMNTAMWTIQSNAIHAVEGALSSAYGYAQKLNKGLTDIAIVSDLNTQQLTEFARTANKMAQELSASTADYVSGALIYYQAGLSDEEVIERTNTTIKLAQTSGESAEQISSYMTAIWNNFYDGSKSVEYYADAISYLGAVTAASNADIAEGMQSFAAVADTVGLSFEYGASALTLLRDITQQSASTIGNSLKTIFARLSSVAQGDTLEDGVDLTKYSKALDAVGVSVLDVNGNLRDMDSILDDLGARWDSLGNAQKVALAQTVGGVRQYNNLISLMDNYERFQELTSEAAGSEGYLNHQAEIYADSWEAAGNRLQAAWQKIYSQLIDDKFIIKMTDFLTLLVKGIGNVIDGLGGLKGLLPMLVMAFTSFSPKDTAAGIEKLVTQFHDLKEAISGAATTANDKLKLLTSQLQIGGSVDVANPDVLEMAATLNKQIERRNELRSQGNVIEAATLDTAIRRYAEEFEGALKVARVLERIDQDLGEIQDKEGLGDSALKALRQSNVIDEIDNAKNKDKRGLVLQAKKFGFFDESVFEGLPENVREITKKQLNKVINRMKSELAKTAADIEKQFADTDLEASIRDILGDKKFEDIGAEKFQEVYKKVQEELKGITNETERWETASKIITNELKIEKEASNELGKYMAGAAKAAEGFKFPVPPKTDWSVMATNAIRAASALGTMNGIMDGVNQAFKEFNDGNIKLGDFLTRLASSATSAIYAFNTLKTAVEAFDVAAKTATTVGLVLIGVLAAIKAISYFFNKETENLKKLTEEQKKLNEEQKTSINTTNDLSSAVMNLVSAYEELSKAGGDTFDTLNDLKEQAPQLIEQYEKLADSLGEDWSEDIDNLRLAYEKGIDTGNWDDFIALNEYLQTRTVVANTANAQNQRNTALDTLKTSGKGTLKNGNYQHTLWGSEQDYAIGRETLKGFLSGSSGNTVNFDSNNIAGYYEALVNTIDALEKAGRANSNYYNNIKKEIAALQPAYKEYIETTKTSLKTFTQDFNRLDWSDSSTDLYQMVFGDMKDYVDPENHKKLLDTVAAMYNITPEDAETILRNSDVTGAGERLYQRWLKELTVNGDEEATNANLEQIASWYDKLPDAYKTFAITLEYDKTKISDPNYLNEMTSEAAEAWRKSQFMTEGENRGFDTAEMQEYADYLASIADDTDKLTGKNDILADSLKEDSDAALLVARSTMSLNKGVESLNKNWDTWGDVLKNSSKESKEYYDALKDTKNAIADMFEVSTEFVENDFIDKHLEDIGKAATGDEKAIEKLRQALADDIVANIITTNNGKILEDGSTIVIDTDTVMSAVEEMRQWLSNNPIEVGAQMNLDKLETGEQEFLDKCNDIMTSAHMTAEQANAFFDAMGFETTFVTEQKPVTKTGHSTVTSTRIRGYDDVTVIGDGGQPEKVSLPSYETFTYPGTAYQYTDYVDAVAMTTGTDGKTKIPKIESITRKASAPMNNLSSSNKGGNGGSKGSGSQPKARTKEKERYHEINSKIEQNAHALEMLNTAEGRAYGQQKLDLMEEKIKLLEEQAELYKQLGQEAQAYFNADKANLEKYGATFNDDRSIANFDAWYGEWVKKYLNNQISEEQMKQIDDYVKKYEDSLKHLNDAEKKYVDAMNQVYDQKLEKIEYRLKNITDLIKLDIDYLDYMISMLNDDGLDTAEAIAYISKEIANVTDQYQANKEALADIFKNHEGITDEMIQGLYDGSISVEKFIDTVGNFTEKEIESIKSIMSSMYTNGKDLKKYIEDLYAKLGELSDKFQEAIDEQIDKLGHMNNMIEKTRNIIDIMGKDTLGISDDLLNRMQRAQIEIGKEHIATLQQERDQYKLWLAQLEAQYAIMDPNSVEARALKEQIDEYRKTLFDLKEEILDVGATTAEAIKKLYTDMIDQTVTEAGNKIAGVVGDFDKLLDAYEKQKNLDDLYLKTYEKTYQTNKLLKDINKSINDTANIGTQGKLRDLQEEILGYQQEGKNVTEEQMEERRKYYELLLAEAALEDAQNAKNMVRMTRDSEGNWSYTYTADQGAIDKLQQEYDDKLFAYEDFNEKTLRSAQDTYVQLQQEWLDALRNAQTEAEVQAVNAYYEPMMAHTKEQVDYFIQRNNELVRNFDVDANQVSTTLADTVYGVVTGFDDMDTAADTTDKAMKLASNNVVNYLQAMETEQSTLANNLDITEPQINQNLDDIEQGVKDVHDAVAGTEDKPGIAKTFDNEFNDALGSLKDFHEKMGPYVQGIMTDIGNINNKLTNLITTYSQLSGVHITPPDFSSTIAALNNVQAAANAAASAVTSAGGKLPKTKTTDEQKQEPAKGSGMITGGVGCFAAGTKIIMANGTEKNIEEIEAGEFVLSYNENTKNYEPQMVINTFVHNNIGTMLNIYFDNNITLTLTAGHPILAIDGWTAMDLKTALQVHGVTAQLIKQGQTVCGFMHNTKIKNIQQIHVNNEYKVYNLEITNLHTYIANGIIAHNKMMSRLEADEKLALGLGLASGGYTGAWGPSGRLAFLHEKELVLNKADTENLLTTVSFVRDLTHMISLNAAEAGNGLGNLFSAGVGQGGGFLDQTVTIHAEFPNATNHSEIEEAFSNLIGLASQYAGRRK